MFFFGWGGEVVVGQWPFLPWGEVVVLSRGGGEVVVLSRGGRGGGPVRDGGGGPVQGGGDVHPPRQTTFTPPRQDHHLTPVTMWPIPCIWCHLPPPVQWQNDRRLWKHNLRYAGSENTMSCNCHPNTKNALRRGMWWIGVLAGVCEGGGVSTERAVRIPLECILVVPCFRLSKFVTAAIK